VPRSVAITIEISVRRGDDGAGGGGRAGANNRDESPAGEIANEGVRNSHRRDGERNAACGGREDRKDRSVALFAN